MLPPTWNEYDVRLCVFFLINFYGLALRGPNKENKQRENGAKSYCDIYSVYKIVCSFCVFFQFQMQLAGLFFMRCHINCQSFDHALGNP